MSQKRRGAAEIFREQNIMQEAKPAPPPAPLARQRDEDLEDAASGGGALLGRLANAVPQQRAAAPARQAAPPPPPSYTPPPAPEMPKTSEELQIEKEPIRVRETGFWIFKRVIVPPNVYVVHTRLGRSEPVTIGLGLSFGYNPYTDAYLVVPAAMQTIGIVANCISREKQGINVLAYVQWQIQDFAIAYRRLDFSDSRDPLAIVSAQLREQAEAAIKDKIATMSVEEVLTDKEPVIDELTTRLKVVAEGRGAEGRPGEGEGLGIKIVTVQIKEARVSSQRLWEHLQAPFRYEQEKTARISQLAAQDEIRQRELETRQATETAEAETMAAIERIKQAKETEAAQARLTEEAARFTREQEAKRDKIRLEEQTTLTQRESQQRLEAQRRQAEHQNVLEQARLETEAGVQRKALAVEQALRELEQETRLAVSRLQAELDALQRQTALRTQQADFDLLSQRHSDELAAAQESADGERRLAAHQNRLAMEEAANRVRADWMQQETAITRVQQEIRNLTSASDLARRLVEKLPEIAGQLPDIHDLRVLHTGDGGYDALAAFVAQVRVLAESLGIVLPGSGDKVQ